MILITRRAWQAAGLVPGAAAAGLAPDACAHAGLAPLRDGVRAWACQGSSCRIETAAAHPRLGRCASGCDCRGSSGMAGTSAGT